MRNFLFLFLFALSIVSCNDLIDTPPKYEITGSSSIVDETSAKAIVNGCYSLLIHNNRNSYKKYHNIFDYKYYSLIANSIGLWSGSTSDRGDNCIKNYNYVSEYTNNKMSSIFEDMLLQTCAIATNANSVITTLPDLPDNLFSGESKKHLLGEAYFMRAFTYLNLFRYNGYTHDINSEYGGVYSDFVPSFEKMFLRRFTVTETYEKLLADLTKAVEADIPFTTPFKSSSILAKLYKAEVLLMRGEPNDAQEALQLCNDVIASDERELEEKYSDIYENKYKSKELMFTRFYSNDFIEYVELPTSQKYYLYTCLALGSNCKPSDSYKGIVGNDARADSLFQDFEYKGKEQHLFRNCFDMDNTDIPMYYARKAQAYIMKAEALMKCGADVNKIYDVLDILRDRGGCEKINRAQGVGQDYLSDLIFKEAIKELNFESPYAWNLLLRSNYDGKPLLYKYRNEVLNGRTLDYVIHPISPREYKLNPNIYQHPIYL